MTELQTVVFIYLWVWVLALWGGKVWRLGLFIFLSSQLTGQLDYLDENDDRMQDPGLAVECLIAGGRAGDVPE